MNVNEAFQMLVARLEQAEQLINNNRVLHARNITRVVLLEARLQATQHALLSHTGWHALEQGKTKEEAEAITAELLATIDAKVKAKEKELEEERAKAIKEAQRQALLNKLSGGMGGPH